MKRIWMLAFILLSLLSIQSTVVANVGQAPKLQEWKNWIADTSPLFKDWKESTVRLLFSESAANGHDVVVWHVEKKNRNLGYLVTTGNGQTLIEYSPITPVEMLIEKKGGTYLYAGPGLHLYRPEGAEQDNWINLTNGETLPYGKPVRREVPKDTDTPNLQVKTGVVRTGTYRTDTNSDHGVAVMIQHGLGQSIPFDKKSLPKTGEPAGYLVYTALDKDYYSVWAITGLQVKDSLTFLEVQDVFAAAEYPVYIRTDVPVNWVGSK